MELPSFPHLKFNWRLISVISKVEALTEIGHEPCPRFLTGVSRYEVLVVFPDPVKLSTAKILIPVVQNYAGIDSKLLVKRLPCKIR